MPLTELTTFLGNWSVTVVSTTPFHIVCAAAATATIIILIQTSLLNRIAITGKAIKTQINMVVFLLALMVHPIRIKYDDNQPPAIDSIAVNAYTIVIGNAISFLSIPLLARNDGSQNK
jgi:hypothetical protein